MNRAAKGNTVKVNYTGRYDDGEVFDSSEGRGPLEFTIGSGQIIRGFENAVAGMSEGEKKTVKIPASEAYGPYVKELTRKMKKNQFPPALKPELGLSVQLRHPDGGVLDMVVTEIEDDVVTLDANHPLAGKDLVFDIELAEIEK